MTQEASIPIQQFFGLSILLHQATKDKGLRYCTVRMPPIYLNPRVSTYTHPSPTYTSAVQSFHQSLPGYQATPLIPLPSLAQNLNIGTLTIKDESTRLTLPAFKILGASFASHNIICNLATLPLSTTTLSTLAAAAQRLQFHLFAATEGNHGRAVAHVASWLGIPCTIFVPGFTNAHVIANIKSEGAEVVQLERPRTYDDAVAAADAAAKKLPSGTGVLVQDNAFEGYTEVPAWIVEGYSTLLAEVEEQLAEKGLKASHIVTPIGVGGLGHAVTVWAKSRGRGVKVISVEPESAACLYWNLKWGRHETVETGETIMDGMNCGTVSPISWPTLREGVDVSVTVNEMESHEAVVDLEPCGVLTGPCGAAGLAALRRIAKEGMAQEVALSEDSVVVLLSTEGKRWYEIPK